MGSEDGNADIRGFVGKVIVGVTVALIVWCITDFLAGRVFNVQVANPFPQVRLSRTYLKEASASEIGKQMLTGKADGVLFLERWVSWTGRVKKYSGGHLTVSPYPSMSGTHADPSSEEIVLIKEIIENADNTGNESCEVHVVLRNYVGAGPIDKGLRPGDDIQFEGRIVDILVSIQTEPGDSRYPSLYPDWRPDSTGIESKRVRLGCGSVREYDPVWDEVVALTVVIDDAEL